MAKNSDTIALLSIHPRHAEAILSGSKTVEFRKRPFKTGVEWVVLYATKPIGQLVGIVRLHSPVCGRPETIWRRFRSEGGILKGEFLDYFAHSEIAVGLMIARAWRFSKPRPLMSLGDGLVPPQSFRYLNGSSLKRAGSWTSTEVVRPGGRRR